MVAEWHDELLEPDQSWSDAELERARRYTYEVWWSEDDQLYLARCVEIPEAMSHGHTQDEAIQHAVDAVAVVLDAAASDPDNATLHVPEPRHAAVR